MSKFTFAAYMTNTSGNHNKHYMLGIECRTQGAGLGLRDEWVLWTAWGRIGNVVTHNETTFSYEKQALEAYTRTRSQKLAAGYVECQPSENIPIPSWIDDFFGRKLDPKSTVPATPKKKAEEKPEPLKRVPKWDMW